MIVGEHKWVFSLGEGDGDPGEYYTVSRPTNLVINSGMRIGPIRGLSARR